MKNNILLVLMFAFSGLVIGELIVTIQCPKSLDIEYSLNCSVSVKNVGNQTVRDITARYYLPSGFTYRGRKTGKFSLKWSTPELKPGAVKNYHCSLKPTSLGEFNFVTKVKTKNSSYKAIGNVKIVSSNIELKVRASSRFIFLNKSVTFKTTIKNSGNGAAYDVPTKGILPSGLEYISSEPQAAYSPPKGKRLARLKWKFAEIAPGEEVSIKVVARGIGGSTDESGHYHGAYAKYSVVAAVKDQEFQNSARIRVE
ncbi:hypothetical protein [Candidatus Uabimicrobium sp. HlEnr_7]|uniref:COG1470 family protein n=1 Tax=Candidatus Uabimicrobium helgolandensis TaxID=3095367 RepID=UPI003558246C